MDTKLNIMPMTPTREALKDAIFDTARHVFETTSHEKKKMHKKQEQFARKMSKQAEKQAKKYASKRNGRGHGARG